MTRERDRAPLSVTSRPRWTRWRSLQVAIALWLLGSSLLYAPGVSVEMLVKDLLAGSVLLVVTAAAAATRGAGGVERSTCLGLGLLLLAAVMVLDDGVGPGSIVAQWNQVVVGVLLICVAAVPTRL